MTESEIVKKLLISFIEEWNDSNPLARMNKDLINLIELYMIYAYVCGYEQRDNEIAKIIKNYKASDKKISVAILKSQLEAS